MWYRRAADLVLLTHLAFVLFVIVGGLLALRWRRLAWVHIPVAIWGTIIEFTGIVCPLTPLENWLRQHGGEGGYTGGFIDHYIVGTLYPAGLTRATQLVLGCLVLALNAVVYGIFVRRKSRSG